MLQVLAESQQSDAVFESGEGELVCGYDRKTGERDWKRVMMKQRDADQRHCKQDEVNGYSKNQDRFDHDSPDENEQAKISIDRGVHPIASWSEQMLDTCRANSPLRRSLQ